MWTCYSIEQPYETILLTPLPSFRDDGKLPRRNSLILLLKLEGQCGAKNGHMGLHESISAAGHVERAIEMHLNK